MALSNQTGAMVVSTGNKSEMAVGYSTLYGDLAGGFALLKDLYKTEVYNLANFRNSISSVIPQNTIDKEPSAELRPDQFDKDSLPNTNFLMKFYVCILKKIVLQRRLFLRELMRILYMMFCPKSIETNIRENKLHQE